MREETINKVEAAFSKFLNRFGEDFRKAMTRSWRLPNGEPTLSKQGCKAVFTRAFRQTLRHDPEPDPKKVKWLMGLIEDAPQTFRHMALEAIRELPNGAGRPRKLKTPEQRARLCARISELLPQCEESRYAFLKAAAEARPPVSERTARRIWVDHLKAVGKGNRKGSKSDI